MAEEIQSLFIPSRLNVGFVKREGTFDGKLSYIIYFDEKGKLRKEASWNSWRDESLSPAAFDNKPQKGLIINKGIKHYAYHFGSGKSMARIYDPRGFEFEITMDNLVGIINQSNIDMSEIVQECVYSWAGTELVLLPTNSEQYKASLVHTENKNSKISLKDLKVGQTYSLKNSESYHIYIGHYEINNYVNCDYTIMKAYLKPSKSKKHIFYSVDEKMYKDLSGANLGRCIDSGEYDDINDLVNDFVGSHMNKRISHVDLFYDYTLKDLMNNTFGDSRTLVFGKSASNHRIIYELVYRDKLMELHENKYHKFVSYNLNTDRYFVFDGLLKAPKLVKDKTKQEEKMIDYDRYVYSDGMAYTNYNVCKDNQSKRDNEITDFEKFQEDMYIRQYTDWKNKLNMGLLQVVFEDGTKEMVHVNIL